MKLHQLKATVFNVVFIVHPQNYKVRKSPALASWEAPLWEGAAHLNLSICKCQLVEAIGGEVAPAVRIASTLTNRRQEHQQNLDRETKPGFFLENRLHDEEHRYGGCDHRTTVDPFRSGC